MEILRLPFVGTVLDGAAVGDNSFSFLVVEDDHRVIVGLARMSGEKMPWDLPPEANTAGWAFGGW